MATEASGRNVAWVGTGAAPDRLCAHAAKYTHTETHTRASTSALCKREREFMPSIISLYLCFSFALTDYPVEVLRNARVNARTYAADSVLIKVLRFSRNTRAGWLLAPRRGEFRNVTPPDVKNQAVHRLCRNTNKKNSWWKKNAIK